MTDRENSRFTDFLPRVSNEEQDTEAIETAKEEIFKKIEEQDS